ncbi:hypothetical protein AMS68_001243 [Peltaster fructicola]|uniref:CID domain-containing protein n=1 Tax=Peltaster fructicola TaxID=286661 RepID=A0A6H0XLZ4_9PEZI|nr:hypothetical protein AMS68_001243 [Peltaster fructicola]
MDVEETEKRFPGVKAKLNAPKPLSAYAREQKAAEAKKREDEAANAEALRAFQESLDYDEAADKHPRREVRDHSLHSHAPRRFNNHGRNYIPASGPGSLDIDPTTFDHQNGPPNRKRRRDYDRSPPPNSRMAQAQEEDERGAPEICIYLESLAPNLTEEDVKEILSPYFTVEEVKMHVPVGSRTDTKKVISATAFLASDTTTKQIDDTITKLRNRYVGCGFELRASRIKSSSSMHPSLNGGDQPFGAQPVQTQVSLKNAAPAGEKPRWAPPDRYDRRGPQPRTFEVNCDHPLDLNTVRAIHVITDQLLSQRHSERALELEALLMSMPEVQQDRRFAFLFDSKSPEGLYYRYCLWRDHGDGRDLKRQDAVQIWDDVTTQWKVPDARMLFSNLVDLADAVQHDDYASSDEEHEDEQAQALPHQQKPGVPAKISITPLQRAHLTHLLARLPTAHAKLRKGDVARVTDFAISHAATGVEEIVDMLLLNVDLPFSSTSAASYEQEKNAGFALEDDDEEEEYDPEKPLHLVEEETMEIDARPARHEPASITRSKVADTSGAKFIALYVINDIVKAQQSSEGARNAWKYRQLLENGLKHQKTFERLGILDRQYSWGKLKTEQWKRKIFELLDMWEKQSVFSGDAIAAYKADFLNDPKMQNRDVDGTIEKSKDVLEVKKPKWISQFQDVKANAIKTPASTTKPALLDPDSLQYMKKTEEDIPKDEPTGEPQLAAQDHKISNAPSSTTDTALKDAPAKFVMKTGNAVQKPAPQTETKKVDPVKKRMRAEDMFAEEDE